MTPWQVFRTVRALLSRRALSAGPDMAMPPYAEPVRCDGAATILAAAPASRAALLPEIAAGAAPRLGRIGRLRSLETRIASVRFGDGPRAGAPLSPRAERRLAADPFARRLDNLD